MPEQLTLDLPLRPRFGPEDFLVGPSNEVAFSLIERWPDWPDPVLRLEGPEGSGKSHLAAIWAQRMGAVSGYEQGSSHSARAYVLEDCDRSLWNETELFHFLNWVREYKISVLLTSRTPPEKWNLATPDLLSRLRLGFAISIEPPDTHLLKAVLVKLLLDRQLMVDATIVDYLAGRIERSFACAGKVVHTLDRLSLLQGRKITRALAALAVETWTREEGDQD